MQSRKAAINTAAPFQDPLPDKATAIIAGKNISVPSVRKLCGPCGHPQTPDLRGAHGRNIRKTNICYAVCNIIMAARNKAVIAAAVAAAAIICIAGTYLILTAEDEKENIRVTVPAAAESEMVSSFKEFSSNTKANVITDVANPSSISSLGNDEAVISDILPVAMLASAPPEIRYKEVKVIDTPGTTYYVYYNEDASEMVLRFINWLGQSPLP